MKRRHYEIGIVESCSRSSGQNWERDLGYMVSVPEEADSALTKILAPYGSYPSGEWYLDNCNYGRPPAPWAFLVLPRECRIAGHIRQARLDLPPSEIGFCPYTLVPNPIPANFVPSVGTILVYSKSALKSVAHESKIFEIAWGALQTCDEQRNWLFLATDLDPDWIADIEKQDAELVKSQGRF